MPKRANQSGKKNFLITMSKQTHGSDGFMPSGKGHQHRNIWIFVIGIIMIIVLFIFGENMIAGHQSKSTPTHHTKVTRVAKKRSSQKANKAKQARKEAAAKRQAAQKRHKKVQRERHQANSHNRRARVSTRQTRRPAVNQGTRSTARATTSVRTANTNVQRR